MKKTSTPLRTWFEEQSRKRITVSSSVKDSKELSPAAKKKMDKAQENLRKPGLPKEIVDAMHGKVIRK